MFYLPPQRCNINNYIKKIYFAYFGVPLGDQDKKLGTSPSLHNVCRNIEILVSRKGCEAQIWCVNGMERTKNHVDDCYFCLVNGKGFNKKNKQHLQYINIHSAMRPTPHSDKVPVPIFTKLQDIDEGQLRSSTSSTNSDDDDKEQDIAHEAWNAGRVSLYSQSELNDLIRDLNLPKQSAEVLAFRQQEKHLLKAESTFTLMASLFTVQMLRGFFLLWVCLHIVQTTGDFLLIAQKEALSVPCSIMVTSMDPSL